MKNPFTYGGVVSGKAFCNRRRELADLLRAMENSERLFLYSERRFGKTSLVRLAMSRLPRERFLTAYVDLWPTDGEASFVTATARAVSESMSTTADKLLGLGKKFFSRLTPSVTIDERGRPRVTFGIEKRGDVGPELEQVLTAPARMAAGGRHKIAVIFDEFQQILEYGSDLVERKLRSVIQGQKGVSYIFLGSRKHLIQKMFLDQSRPLYRIGGHYPLGAIQEKDWLPFIRERFNAAGRRIADEQIVSLCRLTEGHPFYTQHLCHALWDLAEEGAPIRQDLIDKAVDTLLSREGYAYATLWESLTLNQRRFLKGLANEELGAKPFASVFVQQYNLGSASNAQRAAEALLAKDVIDRDNGSFIIMDRFLKLWIKEA